MRNKLYIGMLMVALALVSGCSKNAGQEKGEENKPEVTSEKNQKKLQRRKQKRLQRRKRKRWLQKNLL